jgi:hypothetical protein
MQALEDTGQPLSIDAKERAGQGLSRLLNAVESNCYFLSAFFALFKIKAASWIPFLNHAADALLKAGKKLAASRTLKIFRNNFRSRP